MRVTRGYMTETMWDSRSLCYRGGATRQEVATLHRLGFSSAQDVGSSPDAWPQQAVSGMYRINRVR
jgi:hypothetical protein